MKPACHVLGRKDKHEIDGAGLNHLFVFHAAFLCVALAVPELRDPSASAQRVLGLKVCPSITWQN